MFRSARTEYVSQPDCAGLSCGAADPPDDAHHTSAATSNMTARPVIPSPPMIKVYSTNKANLL